MQVSAILTVYNEARHLRQCLASLCRQNFKSLEIIVVDDGSSDSSRRIAGDFPIKLIKQNHLGLGASRNRGAEEAGGEILVFCDGDLVYDKNYIARLVAPILKGEAVGTFHKDEMVKNDRNFWSRCWQINDGLPFDRKIPANVPDESIFYRAIKRDVFLKTQGGFDNIGYLDDRTLFQKVTKKARGVTGAICWHYNPECWREVIEEARWHGKSFAKTTPLISLLQYSLPNSLRRTVIDTSKSGELLYGIFKITFDVAVTLGIIEGFLGKSLAK